MVAGACETGWKRARMSPGAPRYQRKRARTSPQHGVIIVRFENQTFTGDITLDYNDFINCTFGDGSVIHYGGGQYSLQSPTFAGGIRFTFHDNAHRTLIWLKFLSSMPNGRQLIDSILESIPTSPPQMSMN